MAEGVNKPRHVVLASGWDDKKNVGWMQFQCLRCGYEYKMLMYTKVRKHLPPLKPGGRTRSVRTPIY